MAPKKDAAATSTFSFEVVAILVAVLKKKGANLGVKEYQLMAELDGTRSAFAFDHMFRKVKTRANEIIENLDDDSTPKKKTGAARTSNASNPPKPKPHQKRDYSVYDDTDDAESESEEETPGKKIKVEGNHNSLPYNQMKSFFD